MTSANIAPGNSPEPEAESGHRRYRRLIILLLLLALAWVGAIGVRYLMTGKPISEIAPLPQPIASALEERPKYVSSLDNVARPLGVAIGKDGSLYVPETAGDRMVLVFDSKGKQTGAFAPHGTDKANRNPAYVATSPSGDVYVSDIVALTVYIFSPSGEAKGEVASPFEGGWVPLAMAFDKSGNLYVTDVTPGQHRVVVLDPAGKLLRTFGKEGPEKGEFSFPNAIAVDGKGNIYVADSGNGRLQAFDKDGGLRFLIGRGVAKGDLGLPRGVAVDDSRQELLVVDTTNGQVNVYDISGATPKLVYVIGGEGTAVDAFRFPNGIAYDPSGKIFVTDRENNRVTVWRH